MTITRTLSGPIALRCDATPSTGVGHVVRCLALAEEFRSRDLDVVLWGRIESLGWLQALVAESGFVMLPAPETDAGHVSQAAAESFDAVVLDGYHLSATLGGALRAAGRSVLALVDGEFGAAQEADVYVDQNLGARPHRGGPAGSSALAGPDFALLRDAVLRHRRTSLEVGEIRSVLAVFGGSDPAGAAPIVVPALLATGAALDVTVLSSKPERVTRACAGSLTREQRLNVIPPQTDLARLAASADLVISAAGTTVWELLAIGVPTAVVSVVDNQLIGYRAVLDAGVATGLGDLGSFDAEYATDGLLTLLENPSHATELAIRGQALIDGRGRQRVADELLRTVRAQRAVTG